MDTNRTISDRFAEQLFEPTTSGTNLGQIVGDRSPLQQEAVARAAEKIATSDMTAIELNVDEHAAGAMPSAIVENWQRLSVSGLSGRLFQTITRLALRQEGWRGPGSRALTPDAIGAFLQFWANVRDRAVEPAVALTNTGGLQAQWIKSPREYLDLHFRSPRQVFFGLFRGRNVSEGVEQVDVLSHQLAGHPEQPLTWKE